MHPPLLPPPQIWPKFVTFCNFLAFIRIPKLIFCFGMHLRYAFGMHLKPLIFLYFFYLNTETTNIFNVLFESPRENNREIWVFSVVRYAGSVFCHWRSDRQGGSFFPVPDSEGGNPAASKICHFPHGWGRFDNSLLNFWPIIEQNNHFVGIFALIPAISWQFSLLLVISTHPTRPLALSHGEC